MEANSNIWRIEYGSWRAKGNNYIVYRGGKTRDFDLKLQRNAVVVRDWAKPTAGYREEA